MATDTLQMDAAEALEFLAANAEDHNGKITQSGDTARITFKGAVDAFHWLADIECIDDIVTIAAPIAAVKGSVTFTVSIQGAADAYNQQYN